MSTASRNFYKSLPVAIGSGSPRKPAIIGWNMHPSAGALGDYIDRGHPSPAEAGEAFERMRARRAQALHEREHLRVRVEAYLRTCPEILLTWAQAHRRVRRFFIHSLQTFPARPGFDIHTARYVARKTLEAWEAFPEAGETHIPIPTAYLEGYFDRLDAELKG